MLSQSSKLDFTMDGFIIPKAFIGSDPGMISFFLFHEKHQELLSVDVDVYKISTSRGFNSSCVIKRPMAYGGRISSCWRKMFLGVNLMISWTPSLLQFHAVC